MKKSISNKITTILLLVVIAGLSIAFAACGAKPAVSGIEVLKGPTVTDYIVGDIFSLDGGVIKVTYSDGSTANVPMTDEGISFDPPDMSAIANRTIIITYGGKTDSFVIRIAESGETAKVMSSLNVTTEPKVKYAVGEAFDPDGGVVTAKYEDKSSQDISFDSESVTLYLPNMNTIGNKIVTIVFGEFAAVLEIKVVGKLEGDDEGEENPDDKPVLRIAMKNEPLAVEYFVGDEFSPVGGSIIVTYSDSTTAEVPLTAKGVTLSELDMTTSGLKSVTVTYGKRRTTFSIAVVNVAGVVTFETGYEDGENKKVKVAANRAVSQPEDPERTGYTFYKWYTTKDCTIEYDFSSINVITGDTTIYAYWKQNGQTYCDVTYDLNYYGVMPKIYPQLVMQGDVARTIATPSRSEYSFEGWFTNEQLTSAYDGGVITGATTIYAKWEKAKVGNGTYIFEAELTDLTGKSGPGLSNSASGKNMIVTNTSLNASGNKFVSYLYRNGNSLDFYIASSETVTDAVIAFRIAAELNNINLTTSNYQIRVNGTAQGYTGVNLVNGAAFSDAITLSGITLNAGYNLIQMVTTNNVNPLGPGVGTYEATAPIVDCIKITTSAVLMWDGNYGLPKSY